MTHGKSHEHDHVSRRSGNRQRLALILLLTCGYMAAEIVGGLATNSLALLADAGHMFSDVIALGLSLFAIMIAERPATPKWTYGFYRTEILAALVNGAALVAVSIYIFIEAYQRLIEPPAVAGMLMMIVALGGLLVNLSGLWILRCGRQESLNVHGAWLHILTDALGSIGAVLAGGLIWAFGWNWCDPAISVLIGVLVIYSAWRLVAESVAVLMEGAPKGIDVDDVRQAILETPGVVSMHDLHVWTITSALESLSAHVVAADGQPFAELLTSLQQALSQRFGISHVTIQIEPANHNEHYGPI
jgi:cobalt-zinc-cadmium efflux system protein